MFSSKHSTEMHQCGKQSAEDDGSKQKKTKVENPVPATSSGHTPQDEPVPEEAEDEEWDLNNAEHVLDYLDTKFKQADLAKAGVSIAQFNKIARYYVDHLKKRTPKAALSYWFKQDMSAFDSSKLRVQWLQQYGALRREQFLQKPTAK